MLELDIIFNKWSKLNSSFRTMNKLMIYWTISTFRLRKSLLIHYRPSISHLRSISSATCALLFLLIRKSVKLARFRTAIDVWRSGRKEIKRVQAADQKLSWRKLTGTFKQISIKNNFTVQIAKSHFTTKISKPIWIFVRLKSSRVPSNAVTLQRWKTLMSFRRI